MCLILSGGFSLLCWSSQIPLSLWGTATWRKHCNSSRKSLEEVTGIEVTGKNLKWVTLQEKNSYIISEPLISVILTRKNKGIGFIIIKVLLCIISGFEWLGMAAFCTKQMSLQQFPLQHHKCQYFQLSHLWYYQGVIWWYLDWSKVCASYLVESSCWQWYILNQRCCLVAFDFFYTDGDNISRYQSVSEALVVATVAWVVHAIQISEFLFSSLFSFFLLIQTNLKRQKWYPVRSDITRDGHI